MVRFRNGFAAPIVFVTSVGLVIATSGAIAHSNESNCRRLEDFARQYAGVQLTSQQQKLKAQAHRLVQRQLQADAKRRREGADDSHGSHAVDVGGVLSEYLPR